MSLRPLIVLPLLLLAGCGAGGPDPGHDTARIVLDQERRWDQPRSHYPEGSLAYARVEDQAGKLIVEERNEGGRITRELPPGTYRLSGYQRPCGGSCAVPRKPTDACSRTVELEAGARVNVTFRHWVGRPCEILVDESDSA
jgi:hypothetical protein